MKKIAAILALSGLLAAPVLAQPQYSGGNRPVTLSANDGLDPCGFGAIRDPEPEGAVMVFPGDSTDLDYVDYLNDGAPIWLCDSSDTEDMVGIVYSNDPGADCEVSSPVAEDRDYVGPCSWGWVKSEWVELLAG